MSYDLIIKNGTVILEQAAIQTDVAVKDGKIVAIGKGLNNAIQVIDAEGLIVSPGMIDAHAHISEPGRTEWEGYETATRSAAKGGITTLIEMPLNQLPATVDLKTLQLKLNAGKGKLNVDISSFGGLVPTNLDKIDELSTSGISAYKCFMATCGSDIENDFKNITDRVLFYGMKEIAKTGLHLAIHAENATICDELGAIAKQAGKKKAKDYVDSRPVFNEVEAVRRAIYFAKVAHCPIHICHVSCPEAIDEITQARKAGQPVTAETCTHYLALDLDDFERIGNAAKCSPPLRDKNNQNRLWDKVFSGEIDLVCSDHSPCTPDLKEGTIFESWGGISGLQNTMDIFFDEAVQKRNLPLPQFAHMIATRPAELYHLKNKGSIALGKDADIILIRPNSSYVVKAEDLEYKNKISAYIGRKINAQVEMTFVRGHLVYDKQHGFVDTHQGEFIAIHRNN